MRARKIKDIRPPSQLKDSGSEQLMIKGGMSIDSRDSRSKSKSKSRSSRTPKCFNDSRSE